MNRLAQTTRLPIPGVEIVDGVATFRGFEWIFSNIVTVILYFAAVVLFVMFLIGGFNYLTSGGNPKKAEAAKNTLTYSIGGMIVLVLAFLILRFIQVLTGAPITTFRVYQP